MPLRGHVLLLGGRHCFSCGFSSLSRESADDDFRVLRWELELQRF